jgi:L-ectoine synthase
MIVRSQSEARTVDWGNGLSHRYLLAADRMGFTICHTTVRPGTKSRLEYRRHLEACLCIRGKGSVVTAEGVEYALTPGVMYALNEHDAHFLIADPDSELELISVFNPPLTGEERHSLDSETFSQY